MLGADGSLSIEPVEQVGKVVGVIEFKVNLRYVVHQRWPERDRKLPTCRDPVLFPSRIASQN